ncbi:hypothetical protein L1S32_02885 [Methanogenium sp. S4BF]|uniref:hypothetical protein n=1 Tax=Methanogenium sp. S4BF TaxID=1789226 RepID=UPI002417D2FF|nr:hypothetical protein [Methanogenium sp. S4BF]WFN35081.1 hypothetical protein L1S32_02885 [Methanogenium sp. S4BF]
MHHDLAQARSLPEGCFCIAVAPYTDLVPAVIQILQEERRKTLYVSGNYPPVLTAVDRKHARFSVRRALTAYQYLTILSEAYESCIIIEHDRSVYTDAPETAEPVGRLCREKAEDAAVLLIARKWDAYIAAMAPAAHSVVHVPEKETWPAAVHERSKKKETADTGRRSAQRHLWDGDWQ